MRNRDGKAGIVIIILLGIIILIVLVPWYFIVMRNLNSSETDMNNPAQSEETFETETVTPAEEEQPYIETNVPPEEEREPDRLIIFREKETDIATEFPALNSELNSVALMHNTVAASLVVYNGETGEYFTYVYGFADSGERRPVNPQTKFRVAALAKLTTVICAMALVDEELLDLDMDISVYLGYEVSNTNHPGTVITTRMLMQHTSSIFDSGAFQMARDRNSSDSLRTLLERGSSFRRSQPGTSFEYTNFGYAVLGAICENISGKSLDTLARDVIFEPLGIDAGYVPGNLKNTEDIAVIYNEMHVETYSLESQLEIKESSQLGQDLHLAQGSLTISAVDYARILAMLGNGGVLRGTRVLSEESVRDIHNTTVEAEGFRQGLATRYSRDDILPDEGFYWLTGGAYGTFSQYISTTAENMNRGVVVVTTGATTDRDTNGMVSLCTSMMTLVWEEQRFFDENYEDIEDLGEVVDD